MKINDYLTFIGNPQDLIYLKSKAFPVNMRLFKSSSPYRALIGRCCDLIREYAVARFDDYKAPHGMSGANAAIPFNIIAIVRGRETDRAWADIMINPKITRFLDRIVETESNCGSIRLEKPLKLKRHESVQVQYYDEYGNFHDTMYSRADGSLTIQHEIDHNLGVLITDRALELAA